MSHHSQLAGFIIDCKTDDLAGAAEFWGRALRMELRRLPEGEGGRYVRLVDPLGRLHIEVQSVDHPSRVHLDIQSEDVDAEVARLEGFGARRVAQVHSWWVMEAPTGQRFCVVRAKRRQALDCWHDVVRTRDVSLLNDLLAEDAVFESPAVHAPQAGKEITTKYLEAACRVLVNDSFRYVNEWHGANSAVLEFETRLGEVELNGIDIITWNEEQRIVHFKVMVRPMKALQTLLPLMAKELQAG